MRFRRQSTDTGSERSHPQSHSFQMEGGGSEVSDSNEELRSERVGGWFIVGGLLQKVFLMQ